MNIASRGATMAVDWEQRIDFDRLRKARLEKTKAQLASSELGALLLFDPNNLRYVTSTAIGTWERDKNIRFALVFREDDPVLWDFGSAARHHKLYCPWLPESSWQAWVSPMRGAMPDETGVPDALASMVHHELRERGLAGEPVGVDVPDMTTLLALQRAGLHLVDSQPVMLEARKIKTEDELALLDHAAGIVDAVYEEIYRMLRPGREGERGGRRGDAAALRARLRARRGDQRDLRRSLQPASTHVLRPSDQARRPGVLRHHPLVHGLSDVLLPHVQRRVRDALPDRRLQAMPGVAGRGDRAGQARRDHGRDRSRVADGGGDRHAGRASRVRPPVRTRPGRRALRVPDDLAAPFAGGACRARGRNGVRARDVLSRRPTAGRPLASRKRSSSRPPGRR